MFFGTYAGWKSFAGDIKFTVSWNPRLCNRRSYWCGTGGVSLSFQIFAKKHEAHYSWYTDTAQCVLGTVFNPLVWPFDTSYPFVVVMGSAFGIAISVDNAIKNIPVIYTRAALTMGASRRQMYCYVLFPACLPEMIAGLKQGWSFAWRALMAGEVMTTSIGLGQTLIMGRDLADINQVMLVMIVIVVVGIVIDKCIFSVIERYVLGKRGLQK